MIHKGSVEPGSSSNAQIRKRSSKLYAIERFRLPYGIIEGRGRGCWRLLSKVHRTKTAKDRFIVHPNNVTIGAYATFEVTDEPVVIYVPALSEPRWYILQLGDFFDEIFHNIRGLSGSNLAPTS